MQPLAILILITLALTWARLYRPVHRSVEGHILRIEPLPLLAKIRMHAIPSVFAVALTTALAALDQVAWWLLGLPVVSSILLLVIPVRYTITDRGIRLGWTEFRRWTEFAGVRRTPFGAQLVGMSGHRRLNIWLSGSRDDDAFLHFLRQSLKNAYKGTPVVNLDTPASVSRIDPPMAAFSTLDRDTRR
jgi:hypothetical protein